VIKKSYKTSALIRVLTLGLKRYGVKIASGDLIKVGLFSKRMLIDDIDTVAFKNVRLPNKPSSQYNYVFTNKKGKTLTFSHTLLEGITAQELLRDLKKLNPNITFTLVLEWFMADEIVKKKLKFDFYVYENSSEKSKEFWQKYPSLSVFLGVTGFVIFGLCLAIIGGIGEYLLTQRFGDNYSGYRMVALVTSGVAFAVAMINLLCSLVSMYLGHKVTVISLIISVIGFFVGIL